MHRFLEKVIFPILDNINIGTMVEIGSQRGDGTLKLIEYCKSRGSFLISIDPLPQFDFIQIEAENDKYFKMICDLSLNALQEIHNVDVVLIDGDHNWYTVYNELRLIYRNNKGKFPIVFFHDIGWPYGRRDLYYDPKNIPIEFLHPYKKSGILPHENDLIGDDGLNCHLNNAIYENGEQNGVLTAIEDFMAGCDLDLTLYKADGLNGFGILFENHDINHVLFCEDKVTVKLLELTEHDRISKEITLKKNSNILQSHKTSLAQIQKKLQDNETMLAQAQESLSETKSALKDREVALARTQDSLSETQSALKDRDVALARTQDSLSETQSALKDREVALAQTQDSLSETKSVLKDKEAVLIALQQTLQTQMREKDTLANELASVLLSRSWRYTRFIRKAIRMLKRK